MIRLYLPFFLALLFLVVPKESVGQNGELAGLTELHIVTEKLSDAAKQLGLTETQIKDHILVFVQSKLPHLAVAKSVGPFIHVVITINYVTTESGSVKEGYFGLIEVMIYRNVMVLKTAKVVAVPVWINSTALVSPQHSARSMVRGTLDDLLTKFAADWYRDNPSK